MPKTSTGGRRGGIRQSGANGMLKLPRGSANTEIMDVSGLKDYLIKEKGTFEDYMKMKNERVENGYVIDKNGNVIYGAKGNGGSVGFTEDVLKKGNIITHNHPGGYGGTFSDADISALTTKELKEIRAVAKEGTYRMSATSKANPMGLNKALAKDLGKIKTKANNNWNNVKYKSGMSKSTYRNTQRKAYVDTLHNWYSKNASKFGYNYSFKANKDYSL